MPVLIKDKTIVLLFWLVAVIGAPVCSAQDSGRVTMDLDTGWLFNRSDNSSFSGGTDFNDRNWERVCLPHANVITRHAYMDTSSYKIITWYRRHFSPSAAMSGRRFIIEFQAVAVIATVYVNGVAVGIPHKGAYTPFTLDITDHVRCGGDNVVAVKVDSRLHPEIPPEGRPNLDFMVFGGIVRPVTMIITDPLHIEWTFVATPNPTQTPPGNTFISAKTRIVNKNGSPKTCTVITDILDGSGTVVASAATPVTIPGNGVSTVSQNTGEIMQPQLWSIDHPALYGVSVRLQDENRCIDEYRTRTGIRSLTISKTDGRCYLNGTPIKLRGLNRHETYPYIGRAAPKRLQRKDADILKYDLGCNVVRTSHYPQAPEFFDRCDEVGLLVFEEIPGWQYLGTGEWRDIAKQNLVDMVMRDRNHPCILSWGCRVNESVDDTWYKSMNDTARALGPTRLTHGVRYSNGIDPAYFYEDIWTRNFIVPYENPQYVPFITTEFAGHSVLQQAHAWDDDRTLMNQFLEESHGHAWGQNNSYQYGKWGGLIGWCAFDYNSPHRNATYSDTGRNYMGYVSPHGVSSIFRIPKFAGYFYQSQRDPALYGPMVFICSHWLPSSTSRIIVVSNCEEVALYRNDVLIDKITPNYLTSLPHPCFQWLNVSFEQGNLKAFGYIGGMKVAEHTVYTPGNPAELRLEPDTTTLFTGGDMTSVVVSLIDDHGQVMHYRSDSVELSAGGSGDFIGESKTALEAGRMAFYVRTRGSETGTITCQARCAGMSATATVSVVKKVPATAFLPYGRTPETSAGLRKRKSARFTAVGHRVPVPQWVEDGMSFEVFDCRGRLLYKTSSVNKLIDLKKTGIAQGVHIIAVNNRKTDMHRR